MHDCTVIVEEDKEQERENSRGTCKMRVRSKCVSYLSEEGREQRSCCRAARGAILFQLG